MSAKAKLMLLAKVTGFARLRASFAKRASRAAVSGNRGDGLTPSSGRMDARRLGPFLWQDGRHHLLRGDEPWFGERIQRNTVHPRAHIFVARNNFSARHASLLMQNPRAVQQWILRFGRFDLRNRCIA